ncbi:uncharacterized protein LOC130898142 [Diorhabda carinulata]|uniref:uncharacterized protein LOC130898142 n=1 Tax=Diorhabda carinulata TaxID=1163345 RepID=UPI0025A106FF|nr:uncharacterized protein LOC130898142 [Diorhabda carinulata]
MASATEDEPEPIKKIRKTLSEIKEDILTKFDEIMTQTRIQMENINEEMRVTIEDSKKKLDADFIVKADKIYREAHNKVKEIEAETESQLQDLWKSASRIIMNTGASLNTMLRIENIEAFIKDLINNMEKMLSELLEHLNILTTYIIQEQQIFIEKLKIKMEPSNYIVVFFLKVNYSHVGAPKLERRGLAWAKAGKPALVKPIMAQAWFKFGFAAKAYQTSFLTLSSNILAVIVAFNDLPNEREVQLLWIPGHMVLRGTEIANELTRLIATQPTVRISHSWIQEHLKLWEREEAILQISR